MTSNLAAVRMLIGLLRHSDGPVSCRLMARSNVRRITLREDLVDAPRVGKRSGLRYSRGLSQLPASSLHAAAIVARKKAAAALVGEALMRLERPRARPSRIARERSVACLRAGAIAGG